MPMDIEWAKDADDGHIYIIQARPETVASHREPTSFETYNLKESAPALVTGRAVGEKIAVGPVRVIADAHDLEKFLPGEILVTESTSPDWEPVMKIAAAIVTERGGRPVVAVRASARGAVPGIVHDTSNSGQTLFVEPFAIVELSNRLRELEGDERDEVARILAELSRQVGDYSGELAHAVEVLEIADQSVKIIECWASNADGH